MKYFVTANGEIAVNESNIAYWYQAGQLLNITYINGSSVGIAFSSIAHALAARIEIAEELYKDMASIPASSGIVYNIQCRHLKSYTLATATFTFNFPVSTLTLVCDSAGSATLHQAYLDKVIYSARLSRNWIGKTIVYVTTTIQSAINAASSGNVVYVPKGYYYEQLTLKNGVDLYFEKGATVVYGSYYGELHTIIANNVSCNIFGSGTFVYNSGGLGIPNALFKCTGSSTIYWEFESVFTTREAFYINTSVGTYCTIKGLQIIGQSLSTGNSSNFIDSDDMETMDIDIIKLKVAYEYWFGYVNRAGSTLIARNTLAENARSSICFNITGIFETMNLYLVSIAHKNYLLGSIFATGGDWDVTIKAFNCYYEASDTSLSKSFAIAQSNTGNVTVTLFGNNYFNVDYDTISGLVSLSGGTYVLNSSFTIFAT